MSCGQLALNRLGIKYDNYYASEIEKHAISVTMANFPNTIQLGDVRNVKASDLPKIDLMIGGSPCQSFSFAGKMKGMSTKDEKEILTLEHYLELKSQEYEFEGQSYLFWEYMRLLNELKPKYFFLENVVMVEKWERILTRAIGVSPIKINSNLVSAQNRERLYWTNIGQAPQGLFGDMANTIPQPKDKKILLKDILQDNPNAVYYTLEKQSDIEKEPTPIEDRYFLSDTMTKNMTIDENGNTSILGHSGSGGQKGNIYNPNAKIGALCATDYTQPKQTIQKDPEVVGLREVRSEEAKQIRRENNKKGIDTNPFRKKDIVEREDGKTGTLLSSLTNDNLVKIKDPIPVDDKYYIELTDGQKKKFNELNVETNKSGTLTEAIGRGGSSDDYVSMLKRNAIITHTLEQMVSVRKHEVDIPKLQKLLKKHQKPAKEVAEALGIPQSKVEHWFRKDKYFAIPDAFYWKELKSVLGILTEEFDASILEFEEKEGVYDKCNRVYDEDGIAPTLTQTSSDEKILVREITGGDFRHDEGYRWRENLKSGTLSTKSGDGASKSGIPLIKEVEYVCVASRGRNVDGSETTEQQLEPRNDGKTNTLTTVQKDNMVMSRGFRIRRLTPLECERLQTVPDDYTNHVSNTQRYKMLGNGWTISVISHILSYMSKDFVEYKK
jgi:site-specific DNA-cytosine methylase